MASELRWILAAICVPLLFAIWWWSARRSRQAPGHAELRESTATSGSLMRRQPPDDESVHSDEQRFDADDRPPAPGVDAPANFGGSRDWGVSPFEPLSIRTADFESVEIDDLPMSAYSPGVATPSAAAPVHIDVRDIPVLDSEVALTGTTRAPAEPARDTAPGEASEAAPTVAMPEPAGAAPAPVPAPPAAAAPAPVPVAPPVPPPAPATPPPAAAAPSIDTAASGSRQAANASQLQRIVGVRVCATGAAPWDGAVLMATLENRGLAFGRYQVFHRRHADGRSLFCAASLVEPGTFNVSSMPKQQFPGVTLFAVLPGPAEPVQTFDALIRTAVELAHDLHGTVQDASGVLLSPERLEAMREDVLQFQSMLSID